MDLFATRNRKGELRLFTSDDVIKNNGRGYWIPKYNSKVDEITIDKNEFPEISWDDTKPTRLTLVNPSKQEENIEDVLLAGTIEINASNNDTSYNIKTGSRITVFINDISYIESLEEEKCKSILHMKNGDTIRCEQTDRAIKHLINQSKP